MQLRNLLLVATKQFSRLQGRSEDFWRQAGNSYLASSPEVYQRRELALNEALAKIGPVQRAVDVGCGDGRFTMLLCQVAREVVGFDIADQLIASARAKAAQAGQSGVSFELAELEEVPVDPPSDVVACLGVTSCVLDEGKFGRVLDRLASAVAMGGHLLMVDTLSDGREEARAYRSGYVGKYRTRAKYEQELRARGLQILDSQRLADMGGVLGNYFYLFKRA